MRDRASEPSAGGRGRWTWLAAPAGVAASTFALALPLALPTLARAHTSGRHHAASHGIALHAAKLSAHEHDILHFYPADLAAPATSVEFSVRPLEAVPAIHPRDRLAGTASARGPP